jgi:multidrug efflux pump subunit AcrB
LLGVAAVIVALLPSAEWGQAPDGSQARWDVIVEHFGIDADEIERSVTVPLESEMARLPGIAALRSVSKFGKSRVTAELAGDVDRGAFFLALSDAVDRVEADLPPSSQKPRIVSSGGPAPSFIVALDRLGRPGDFRDWLERTVKPSLERRTGVGEVEVGGGRTQEVHVVVDEDRTAAAGASLDDVARALQTQDVLLPAGTWRGTADRAVSLRGRLPDLSAMAAVPVPLKTGTVPLGNLARVSYAEREPESMSRLDGEERAVLMAHAAGTANLIAFSRQMRAAVTELEAQGISAKIILDEGRVLESALRETLVALIEGLAAVLAVLPLILPSWRMFAGLAVVPLSLVATVAVLGLAGIPVDSFVLAGFTAGFGTVLDFALLVCRTPNTRLQPLLSALLSALVTTLLFLAPLAFLDFVWPGIRTLVVAAGLLLVVSFALTALFVPVLRGAGDEVSRPARWRSRLVKRFGSIARRSVQAVLAFSTRRASVVTALSAGLTLAAAAAVIPGVRLESGPDSPELSVHVEYESGSSLDSVDTRTVDLVARIRQIAGVQSVQSVARPGSADLTVVRSSQAQPELPEAVVAAGRGVPGAFVYIPQPRSGMVSVAIHISGDDSVLLRTLAKRAAGALSDAGVGQPVLNFKDPPRRLAVVFDPVKLDQAGLSAAQAATSLRWSLWGPVAVKWVTDRERDLRVMGVGAGLTRESLMAIPLKGTQSVVRLGLVASLSEEDGGAKIYHENRQRTVSLTVQTRAAPAHSIVSSIDGALRAVAWPSGYAFRVDPRLAEEENHFVLAGGALCLSLVLIGLLFAARTQRLGVPALILAMVPVALAFPVLAMALLGGLTMPAVLALVLSGGTVVNNAVLITDAASSGLDARRAVRRRLPSLAITNLAALLGAVPLALAGQGGLSTVLALVVSGTAVGSFLTTLTTIPALLTLFPRLKA